jgi:hypothetical protein
MPSILADSGNGYHLYIPVDLPNDKASGALVDQFLKALDAKYSNDAVHVDLTTDNASRISKVYGTTARKGESVEGLGRVHRKSAILDIPENLDPVDRGVLQRVAGEAPVEPPKNRGRAVGRIRPETSDEWLDKWLEKHTDVPLAGEWKPWQNGGRIVELESCPWNGHEDNAPFLGQLPTGEIVAGCHHNSCEGFTWHDLREHYDPRAERVIPAHDSNDSNDSDPEEVIAVIPDAWEFPLDALPPTTRLFVREGAKSIGCPVDYIGAGVLAALSGAIGDTRCVQIKSDWKESAALYLMIIGAPSAKKSPAMKLALTPVRRRQTELRQQHDAAMERYKQDHKEWKEASKEGPVTYAEPQKPAFGRSWVDDTTVERLAGILDENPRGVLLTKDELSGWLRAMDQYKGGKGSDRQFFLSAHNTLDVAVDHS